MLVRDEPSRGDIARGLIGAICATIVTALLYEPAVKMAISKMFFFTAITVVCVVSARRNAGVLLGIVAIGVLRLVIGIALFGHRFN